MFDPSVIPDFDAWVAGANATYTVVPGLTIAAEVYYQEQDFDETPATGPMTTSSPGRAACASSASSDPALYGMRKAWRKPGLFRCVAMMPRPLWR